MPFSVRGQKKRTDSAMLIIPGRIRFCKISRGALDLAASVEFKSLSFVNSTNQVKPELEYENNMAAMG